MPQVTELTVTVGGTESMGNYNNARYELSQTVRLEPGDELEQVRHSVTQELQTQLCKLFNHALQENGLSPQFGVEPFFVVGCSTKREFILIASEDEFRAVEHDINLPLRDYVCTEAFINRRIKCLHPHYRENWPVFDLRQEGQRDALIRFLETPPTPTAEDEPHYIPIDYSDYGDSPEDDEE